MRKDGFYVQLHLHTSETSRCGVSPAAEVSPPVWPSAVCPGVWMVQPSSGAVGAVGRGA